MRGRSPGDGRSRLLSLERLVIVDNDDVVITRRRRSNLSPYLFGKTRITPHHTAHLGHLTRQILLLLGGRITSTSLFSSLLHLLFQRRHTNQAGFPASTLQEGSEVHDRCLFAFNTWRIKCEKKKELHHYLPNRTWLA